MLATTSEPTPGRSLDAALAGLDALATALERAAESHALGPGRRAWAPPPTAAPARHHRVVRKVTASRPFHREVVRIVVHAAGALVVVAVALGLVGWTLMAVMPPPPRPAVATVERPVDPIHPIGAPAP
jgi:hypothetical protein